MHLRWSPGLGSFTQRKTPGWFPNVQFGGGGFEEAEPAVAPSKAGADKGANTAKDPTADAWLAISVSRSLAMALPAVVAMSDLIAELSGASGEIPEGAPSPVGLSPLHAIARISTPAKVIKLNERFGIMTPLLPLGG